MRYLGEYNQVNHPLIKMAIKLDRLNRHKIQDMFRSIFNNRFFRLKDVSYIANSRQMDELIVKVNRRFRKRFNDCTIRILTKMGCEDFVIEDYKYHALVKCKTPFGERRIECLRFGFDGCMERTWEGSSIGIRLIGFNFPSVLDFKGEKGGLENVISDDYVKYYELIKKEIYAIDKSFDILELLFVDGRS